MEIDKSQEISSAARFFLEQYAEDAGDKWYIPEEYINKFELMDLNPIDNYNYYHDLSYEIFNSDDIDFFSDLLDTIHHTPLVMIKKYIDQVKVFYAGPNKYAEYMKDLDDDFIVEIEINNDDKKLYRIRYTNNIYSIIEKYIRALFEDVREQENIDYYMDHYD